jgi:hypothetical protein
VRRWLRLLRRDSIKLSRLTGYSTGNYLHNRTVACGKSSRAELSQGLPPDQAHPRRSLSVARSWAASWRAGSGLAALDAPYGTSPRISWPACARRGELMAQNLSPSVKELGATAHWCEQPRLDVCARTHCASNTHCVWIALRRAMFFASLP